MSQLAARVGSGTAPRVDKAQRQLRAITYNKWSKEWLGTIARRDEVSIQAELETAVADSA